MKLISKYSWQAIGLLFLLLIVSIYKDNFTPDYRNTPNASFLNPDLLEGNRLTTFITHYKFWIVAVIYSSLFLVIPTLIIQYTFKQKNLTRFTLYCLIGIASILYLSILINSSTLDYIIVSKVNRYFHSPILVLFLWAAYTLAVTPKNDEK